MRRRIRNVLQHLMLQQAGKMGVDVVLQHFRVGRVLRVTPAAVGVFKYGLERGCYSKRGKR